MSLDFTQILPGDQAENDKYFVVNRNQSLTAAEQEQALLNLGITEKTINFAGVVSRGDAVEYTLRLGDVISYSISGIDGYAPEKFNNGDLLPKGTVARMIAQATPFANEATPGLVKIGNNITVDADGRIGTHDPYELPTGTTTRLGGFKVGAGLVSHSGVLKVDWEKMPAATAETLGGIKVGKNLTISADGTLDAPDSYVLPLATPETPGGIKVGENLTISEDGALSGAAPYTLPVATATTPGGIKVGKNLQISADGTLDAPDSYNLTIASGTVLGGIKIGSGLSADASGLTSVDPAKIPFLAAVNIWPGTNTFTNYLYASLAPISNTGVLRKVDLDVPCDVPYTSRSANLGYQLHWVSGAFASAFGGVYATTTTPAVFVDSLSQPNVNSQVWRLKSITCVLSKIAYSAANVKNTYKGTLCQFGYGAIDANVTDNSNRYDLTLNRVGYDSNGNYPAGMCWPASTSPDGKIRVGLADTCIHTGASASALLGHSNLYAVEQADWVQYVFYSPVYPSVNAKTQTRVAYLFARKADNTLVQIGTAPQRSAKVWLQFALALSNVGEGISDYKLLNGDVYGLENIWQFAPNAGDQLADACWPIKCSLFKPTKEAQTISTELTCTNTALSVVAHPDWVTLAQDGNSISLALAANASGAERLGIVDVTLFNGITYSIIIYQQA